MDNKELFQKAENGYNCEQVEQYITVLKTEYKKVFEYAKATEANNEKLKKICRALSDENKTLKANETAPATSEEKNPVAECLDRISKLAENLANETTALRSIIK